MKRSDEKMFKVFHEVVGAVLGDRSWCVGSTGGERDVDEEVVRSSPVDEEDSPMLGEIQAEVADILRQHKWRECKLVWENLTDACLTLQNEIWERNVPLRTLMARKAGPPAGVSSNSNRFPSSSILPSGLPAGTGPTSTTLEERNNYLREVVVVVGVLQSASSTRITW